MDRLGRRDRHGRGLRGPLAPASVPLARTRREEFEDLVLDAVERVERRLARGDASLEGVVFAVEDVPAPEVTARAADVPLGVVEDADDGPPVVVVYRRPIEARTDDMDDVADLVLDTVVELIADLLGLDPDDVDPDVDDED